jgi:hypothetical protein
LATDCIEDKNKYHMKIFKCIVTFQKKLLSCLFFETAKIREVKYESDSINVSGRLSYSWKLKILSDTYTNNYIKRAEKIAIYYDGWIKHPGMKQRKKKHICRRECGHIVLPATDFYGGFLAWKINILLLELPYELF